MKKRLVDGIEDSIWNELGKIAKFKDIKVGVLTNEILAVFIEKNKIRSVGK